MCFFVKFRVKLLNSMFARTFFKNKLRIINYWGCNTFAHTFALFTRAQTYL